MAFGKGNNRGKEYTRFQISKPWGYNPDEVEEAVDLYEKTIIQLKQVIEAKDNDISQLKNDFEKARKEIRNLQLEMSCIELPSESSMAEAFVLNNVAKAASQTESLKQEDLGDEFEGAPRFIPEPEPKPKKIHFDHDVVGSQSSDSINTSEPVNDIIFDFGTPGNNTQDGDIPIVS